MALTSLLAVVCVASFANGLAHNPPRSTAGNQGFGQGWTPAPTTAPKSPHELLRRGLFELEGRELGTTILTGADQTCGYLSGSPGAGITCDGGNTCNFFPAVETGGFGAVACCDSSDCNINLYCVNSVQYYSSSMCNDMCEANSFTTKCTGSAKPFCNTAYYADVNVRDVFCASKSVSTIQTYSTTYRGQTIGGTFLPVVLADTSTTSIPAFTPPTSTPIPTTTTPTSQSPTTTTLGPTTSAAASSSTPTGAIVGGVVGGTAVVALIGFGIWFIMRKNRSKKNANNQIQATPPAYGHSGVGGAYAAPKPVMQTNQQEFYHQQQQQQPTPGGAYFNQPPNPNQGFTGKPVQGLAGSNQNIGPGSPDRESSVSSPGYDGSYPQGHHEVAGNPATRIT